MANVSNKWKMDLDNVEAVGHDIRTKLMTYAISGVAIHPETGRRYNFCVTNNLDVRYPERFKVNWAGKEPRMPKMVGTGISEEVVAATGKKVTPSLYIGRGGRIAIARWAKNLVAGMNLEF